MTEVSVPECRDLAADGSFLAEDGLPLYYTDLSAVPGMRSLGALPATQPGKILEMDWGTQCLNVRCGEGVAMNTQHAFMNTGPEPVKLLTFSPSFVHSGLRRRYLTVVKLADCSLDASKPAILQHWLITERAANFGSEGPLLAPVAKPKSRGRPKKKAAPAPNDDNAAPESNIKEEVLTYPPVLVSRMRVRSGLPRGIHWVASTIARPDGTLAGSLVMLQNNGSLQVYTVTLSVRPSEIIHEDQFSLLNQTGTCLAVYSNVPAYDVVVPDSKTPEVDSIPFGAATTLEAIAPWVERNEFRRELGILEPELNREVAAYPSKMHDLSTTKWVSEEPPLVHYFPLANETMEAYQLSIEKDKLCPKLEAEAIRYQKAVAQHYEKPKSLTEMLNAASDGPDQRLGHWKIDTAAYGSIAPFHIAVGTNDGRVKHMTVWRSQVIASSVQSIASASISTLAFMPAGAGDIYAVGTCNGKLVLADRRQVRAPLSRWEQFSKPILSLAWPPNYGGVFLAQNEGLCYVFDTTRTYSMRAQIPKASGAAANAASASEAMKFWARLVFPSYRTLSGTAALENTATSCSAMDSFVLFVNSCGVASCSRSAKCTAKIQEAECIFGWSLVEPATDDGQCALAEGELEAKKRALSEQSLVEGVRRAYAKGVHVAALAKFSDAQVLLNLAEALCTPETILSELGNFLASGLAATAACEPYLAYGSNLGLLHLLHL